MAFDSSKATDVGDVRGLQTSILVRETVMQKLRVDILGIVSTSSSE